MKTIEESAKEAGLVNRMAKTNIEESFKAGVAFAQRFIPVEEEPYPQNKQILVKTYNGSVYDVCCIGGRLVAWWGTNGFEVDKSTVVEWRPIELK